MYFDNHSETAPCQMSLERMREAFQENPSLSVALGPIYSLVHAEPTDRFVFTSSGAEGVSQVFWSVFLERARKMGKTHIIVSAMEDISTMRAAKRLEELGCTVKIAPVDSEGRIDVAALASLITPRTALVSMTMANGLTGVIQPFEEVRQLCKEKEVLLHLDANYAVGKFWFSFDADYLTFSGDRIHSVKGSGALFAKKEAPLVPLILGGNEQDGLRGGALDVPSLMALSAACQQAELYLDAMSLEVARLRSLLEEETLGAVLYGETLRLPNTTTLIFEGVHKEALLYLLYRKGISASIGGTFAPHLPHDSAISFALSRMTTEEEVQKAIAIIRDAVTQLKTVAGDL